VFNSTVFTSGVRLQRCLPVLAASVVLLTGCGVAGTEFHPGVAAQVGDETITTKHIDQVTTDFCSAAEEDSKDEPGRQPQAMRSLAQRFTVVLVTQAITEQLADDYDVKPTSSYNSYLAQLRTQLGKLDDDQRDAAVEILGAQNYTQDVLSTIGAQELAKQDGGATPTDDDKYAAGQDVLEKWIADHEVEVNPKYGLDVETGAPIDTDLSYALGGTAKDGVSQDPSAGYAAGLPDPQSCLLPAPTA
jgi:hypothetical protein